MTADQLSPDRDKSLVVRRVLTRGAQVVVAAIGLMTVVLLFYPGSGIDERMYHEATARWLAGGPWYLPHQLAGPYVVAMGDVLYPPVMLALFVPFQWIPAQLWYAVPLLVTAAGLWHFRPAWWAWLAIAAICVLPSTIGYVMFGNPKTWLLVLAWITLALGRRWWLVPVALALGALPFGSLNAEYFTTVVNARGTGYLLPTIPLLAIPVIAWLGSRRRSADEDDRELAA